VQRAPATRSQLLAIAARIRLAERGHDLLRSKRARLIHAIDRLAAAVMDASEALEREGALAHAALLLAEALDGPEAVRSAALAARGEVPLEARTERIMGVRVPDVRHRAIGRSLLARGYSLAGSSPRIDEVAERFERTVELVVEVAAEEVRMRRLASEARKVGRRVNALEHVVLPALATERRAVAAKLDEREREDRFRLQRIAQRKARGAS
jgi:V/A-type H+-transporting ATPase subunit D